MNFEDLCKQKCIEVEDGPDKNRFWIFRIPNASNSKFMVIKEVFESGKKKNKAAKMLHFTVLRMIFNLVFGHWMNEMIVQSKAKICYNFSILQHSDIPGLCFRI